MKILIVEDNEKLALMIKKGLEHEGYSADVVHDGLQGYERVLADKDLYDAIVLDLMLPGKTGVAVCGDWRKEGVHTPVLMLTALGTVDDKVHGLDAGADDYLAKPFEFSELVARLRALARRPHAVEQPMKSVGIFTIDEKQCRIKAGKITPDFTLQEYRMMSFMINHANQVISRRQILSGVWDHAFEGFSNVIDVHVRNLRKKLKQYGKNIKTVRGIGYRLEA